MQLAVASHACAGIRQAAGQDAAMAVQAGVESMPGCDRSSEAALPALCHAHCQEAKASLDSVQLPAVEAVSVLPAILPVPPAAERLLMAGPVPSAAFFLQRTTAPPLSIRHCCLRL